MQEGTVAWNSATVDWQCWWLLRVRGVMMMTMVMVMVMALIRREDCYLGEERRESVPESVGSTGTYFHHCQHHRCNHHHHFSSSHPSLCWRPFMSLPVPESKSSKQFLVASGNIFRIIIIVNVDDKIININIMILKVSVDSPRISFSPLQIKGSIEEEGVEDETWLPSPSISLSSSPPLSWFLSSSLGIKIDTFPP